MASNEQATPQRTTPRDLVMQAMANIASARFMSATTNLEDALAMIDALTRQSERHRVIFDEALEHLKNIDRECSVSMRCEQLFAQLRTALS
jgi:hypothetical protein